MACGCSSNRGHGGPVPTLSPSGSTGSGGSAGSGSPGTQPGATQPGGTQPGGGSQAGGQVTHNATGGPAPIPALQSKSIIVSPGHGWTYFDNLGRWSTQRPNLYGLWEDIHTNEICIHFLIPYLEKAGATVYSARERDKNTSEIILDDSDPAPEYSETGSWYSTTTTGLGYGGGSYRYTSCSTTATVRATWSPDFPEAGHYSVRVWYCAGQNRTTDARYAIRHSGGESVVSVNQQKKGSRWNYLGTWYFEKGRSGSVSLSNRSSGSGVVIADAVRFGGGMGSIVRAGSASGKPRWQEAARYWLEYLGAPSSVYDPYDRSGDRSDDVTCRAHYADWQGGDAYLSVHTNAAGGTGTSSFIHNTNPSAGSAELQKKIHAQLVGDIRALWDKNWYDRGRKSANFGELRETNTMPATLVEIAFHDRPSPDCEFLRDPRFRRDVSRALYKGMARYLAPGTPILPLPPTHLRVENTGYGEITVSWRERLDPLETSAKPSGYRVYRSPNGKGFDDGVYTTSTHITFTGLPAGDVVYFRVAAMNAGGESFPTEVLAARVRSGGRPRILVVNGFDRLDENVTVHRDENTFDYIIQHGEAIASAGTGDYYFDSASNEAVADGDVTLDGYRVMDWILGRESTRDETFSAVEQQMLRNYCAGGRGLFLSGTEVAWDLDYRGNAGDRTFFADLLKAAYEKDDAGSGRVTTGSGGIFSGLPPMSFQSGPYPAPYPDAIQPRGGALSCLTYEGTSHTAAIQYAGPDYSLVYFGFPFETLVGKTVRRRIMEAMLRFLL
jgi:N-acetylmuramoyl-L-alanine amidase